MIRKENLEAMIKAIGYIQSSRSKVFEKKYSQFDCAIEVDFNGSGSINYPEDKGMKITRKTTCNFSQPENFVVLECITRLMDKGYRPEHIELGVNARNFLIVLFLDFPMTTFLLDYHIKTRYNLLNEINIRTF